MRNPNGYGQIIKLSGKRRKPYAVRISIGNKAYVVMPNNAAVILMSGEIGSRYRQKTNDYIVEADPDIIEKLDAEGIIYKPYFIRQYKYMEYFEKSKDAQLYLARMNRDEEVSKHVALTSQPSFKDVYEQYVEFAQSLRNKPSMESLRSWKTGYKLWNDVHDIRFSAITTKQLQRCLTDHGDLSKASIGRMMTILKKMYKYALANQITDTDLSQYLFAEHTSDKRYIHTTFTNDEITRLWQTDSEAAKIVLILIYTGMRCSEFLQLQTANIHLNERYLTGGLKTAAGKNRVIPIHKKLVPVIGNIYDANNKYLFPNSLGGYYTYQHFRDNKWKRYMKELGMNHYTHDCRHTCATKLEEAGVSAFHRKLILGHSIKDLTDGTYTHVSHETLIADMDLWLDN